MKPKQEPSKPIPSPQQSPAERREQQRADFSKRVEAEKKGRKP
jgi:hypothetical protein